MKYLAVDLGNVICRVDFSGFKNSLSKILNIGLDDAEYFLNRTQQLHDTGLSNISDELKDHFKIRSPVIIKDLMKEWNNTIHTDHFMVEFLNSLLHPAKGKEPTKIALLSNIGYEHAKLMPNILTQSVFDNSIKFFSCEVGARKPSILYYKTFLDLHPEFKECVYLDDRIENIEAGKKLGLNGIHFVLDQFLTTVDLAAGVDKIKELIF